MKIFFNMKTWLQNLPIEKCCLERWLIILAIILILFALKLAKFAGIALIIALIIILMLKAIKNSSKKDIPKT